MVWLNEWTGPPGPAAAWEARLADIAAHSVNLTHVSPCIHEFTAAGEFGNQDGKAQGSYADIAPHLPALQKMGLKIVPIIYNVGGLAAQGRLHDGAAPVFIKAAVAKAVAAGYAGYNVDNELRGGASEKSWEYLKGYGGHWMGFLNEFADAMHAVNKTLSVDIAGCCGWADTAHPDSPLGHCAGAFAAHEFLYTSCGDYASSKLDYVYGMSSYNAPLNGPPWVLAGTDRATGKNFSYTLDGPAFLKSFANHTMAALGGESEREKTHRGCYFSSVFLCVCPELVVCMKSSPKGCRLFSQGRASTGLASRVVGRTVPTTPIPKQRYGMQRHDRRWISSPGTLASGTRRGGITSRGARRSGTRGATGSTEAAREGREEEEEEEEGMATATVGKARLLLLLC